MLKKRFLFFFRAYNDVDNITPAIYFLLTQEQDAKAHLVFYSFDYDFEGNPNLKFLQQTFGDRVKIEWIGTYIGLDYKTFYRKGIYSKLYRIVNRIWPNRNISHFTRDSDKFNPGVRTEVLKRILQDSPRPVLAVFDQNRMHAIGGLISGLKHCGMKKVVALPVSPRINRNILRSYKFMSLKPEIFATHHNYDGFNKVVHCEPFYADSMERLYRNLEKPYPFEGKSLVLGSLRYCPEWMTLRQDIIPPAEVKIPKRKVNILFLLSSPKTNTSWNEIKTTVNILGAFEDIAVIIKPHTRSKNIDIGDVQDNIKIDYEAESSDLINWADVVMFWGTSMALEAYIKSKTCICLNHVHANNNNYAYYNAGWIINCRDDLVDALCSIVKHPNTKPYKQENIDRMLEDTVFAGDRNKPVPERYVEFLLDQAQE